VSGRFHQSLSRDILISGGEREPAGVVIGTGLFFLAAAWQFVSLPSLIVGLIILSAGLYAVRSLAKRDPRMFKVYQRHMLYRGYYPARSTPAAGTPRNPAEIALPVGLLLGLIAYRYFSPVTAAAGATAVSAVLYFLLWAANASSTAPSKRG
jgi:type IV secretion system protein VirB3